MALLAAGDPSVPSVEAGEELHHPLEFLGDFPGRLEILGESALGLEPLADRFGLELHISVAERLTLGGLELGVLAGMGPDGVGGDSRRGGCGLGIGGAGEMIEVDLLALRGELDPAHLLPLEEAAALGRDPVGRTAFGGPARQLAAALVDRGEVERPFPCEPEDGVALSDVVEASEREAGRRRSFVAADAVAKKREEARFVALFDQPSRGRSRIVPVHSGRRT